jgi:hypothetical protein
MMPAEIGFSSTAGFPISYRRPRVISESPTIWTPIPLKGSFPSISGTMLLSLLVYRRREMGLSSIHPVSIFGSSHAIRGADFVDTPLDEPKI